MGIARSPPLSVLISVATWQVGSWVNAELLLFPVLNEEIYHRTIVAFALLASC